MFEREDEEENLPEEEIQLSVARFEEMIRTKSAFFFDELTFEHIIEYYLLQNNQITAMTVVDYAIEQHPYVGTFLLKKAALYFQLKKYELAEKWLRNAELLDPSDLGIYLLRADMLVISNQHRKAVEVIEKALTFAEKEEQEDLFLELADVYEDWDRYEKVFESLKKCLLLNGNNEEALSRMWYTVELSKRYEESLLLHQNLIDENPYSYMAWHNLGHAYFDLGHYEKAIEAYEFVVAINEKCDLAYRDCGEAYFYMADYKKAIDQFLKAIEFSKPYEELNFSIAYCHEKLKQYSEARSFYKKAVATDQKYDEAYYRIGYTYKREKEWKNALHFFKKAHKLNLENINYLMALAEGYSVLQMPSEFSEVCAQILNLQPRHKKRSTYEKLTEFLIGFEFNAEALSVIDIAIIEKGFIAKFPYLKFVALYNLGLQNEACQLLETALQIVPAKYQVIFKLLPALKTNERIIQIIEQHIKP